MNELALKYGCNPNQKPSRIYIECSDRYKSNFVGHIRYFHTVPVLEYHRQQKSY